jgi:DNA-binding transcriptional ArsR family regulator
MRIVQAAPPLLPIFRSAGQARLLTRLYLDVDSWRSLTELAREAELDPSNVQREVERLERAGLVVSERIGNVRRVRPDRGSRFFPELRGLLLKAFGPVPVLRRLLADVPGIQEAWIFGSWARPYHAPGSARGGPEDADVCGAPGDIDLIVVGHPEVQRVWSACREASKLLGIEVQATIPSPRHWAAADPAAPTPQAAPFLLNVRAQPLVEVLEVGREAETP